MAAAVIRHKVGNFDTWMKGHPGRKAAIEQIASSFRTFRDADDPNSIVIVAEDVDLTSLPRS